MTKRGADQCDEVDYAFHEETGADGVSFNVSVYYINLQKKIVQQEK